MSYHKAYDYVTQKVIDAVWMGRASYRPEKQCSCSGNQTYRPQGHKVSYQCSITAAFTINGRRYCWRHKRMLDQGRTPLAFPPGPVTES